MGSFNSMPRADIQRVENEHEIYRVFKITGKRNSRFYSGSGVEKTYNLAACDDDKDRPDDNEAVPSLREVEIGDGVVKNIIRKEVTNLTAKCPECDTEGVYNERKAERFCPSCGMMLSRSNAEEMEHDTMSAAELTDNLERTPAAAGRYQGEG